MEDNCAGGQQEDELYDAGEDLWRARAIVWYG